MKGVLIVLCALLCASVHAQEPTCGPEDDFLPHPTDCNLYYACTGGVAILNNCPEGLWWNTLTDGCDWPANVNCAAGSSSTSSSTSTTSSSTTSGTTGTGTLPTEPTDTTNSTGTGTLPTEPTDTTVSTSTTSTTTPSTTTLDLSTEPPGGLPESCPAIEDPNEIIRLPHESNCQYYYRCIGGVATLYSCTNDEQFSPTTRVCRSPNAAGCDRCPTILDTPTQVTRLPHETDCHLYHLCNPDATSNVFQCRDDWHFSRSVRECLPQDEAKCLL